MKIEQSQSTSSAETAHGPQRRPMVLSSEQFSYLRDVLSNYSGIYFDSTRQRLLENGLIQRLQVNKEHLEVYLRRLPHDPKELHQLSELVLNHETFFFRNMPHIRALRDVLLPEIHQRKPAGEPLRIWSAGCSTGEEAYSLAITALETLDTTSRPIEIWASDLSRAALRKARAGAYRGRAIGNLPPELRDRYMHQQGNYYVVNDDVRNLVKFEVMNLLDPFPDWAQNIDIIFCQNVTIYFQLETCRQLIGRFYNSLPEGGLLFLGFSETLWNVFDRLQSREVSGAYVYYKEEQKSKPASKVIRRSPASPGEQKPTQQPVRTARTSSAPSETNKPKPSVRRPPAVQKLPAQTEPLEEEQRLQQGRDLLEQGKSQEALALLEAIPHQSGLASQALTLIAQIYADRGELDTAIAHLQRAIQLDSLHEQAYYLLGIIHSRQEQWLLAAQQLERARYLQPDMALISFHLAEAYRNLGRVTLAAREYRNTLLKLDGQPPGTLMNGVAVAWLRDSCQRQLELLLQVP